MNSPVDLHIHSKASDGKDSIPVLLKKIQTLKIKTFALADPNTVDGFLETEIINLEGIRFIQGIEMSCSTDIARCHILGYYYDLQSCEFQEQIKEMSVLKSEKLFVRLNYLKEKFVFIFTEKEVGWLQSQR